MHKIICCDKLRPKNASKLFNFHFLFHSMLFPARLQLSAILWAPHNWAQSWAYLTTPWEKHWYKYFPFLVIFNMQKSVSSSYSIFPAGNYTFKVDNRNTRTRCEICSKLTIKTPKRRQWRITLNISHTLF